MPEWILNNIQAIFENFILGIVYIIGFFCIVLIASLLLGRRKF